MRESETFAA